MKREHLDAYKPKTIGEVFDIVSKLHNKDVSIIKTITAFPFMFIKSNMKKMEYDGFLINGLGKFKTSLLGVNNHIIYWIIAYRKNKITREMVNSKIKELWGVRQYLIKNKKDE